jgi:hypothetical protein
MVKRSNNEDPEENLSRVFSNFLCAYCVSFHRLSLQLLDCKNLGFPSSRLQVQKTVRICTHPHTGKHRSCRIRFPVLREPEREVVMNHLEQLALDAQLAVFVMANLDASEIEFLPLKPRTATDSERESLAARWPGRDLRAAGVIGHYANGHIAMALKVPFDNIMLASLLIAFKEYREALEAESLDCSVEWCERLYALQDPRTN